MSMRGHIAYIVDERVLCWHQDLVYEAKVLEVKLDSDTPEYYVHYKGWKNTYVLVHLFMFFRPRFNSSSMIFPTSVLLASLLSLGFNVLHGPDLHLENS